MILQGFVFLNEESSATSESLSVGNGSILTFQVTALSGGAVSLTLEGKTEAQNNNWTPLAVVNYKKLEVVESIVEEGNYFIPVTGLLSVRVINNEAAGSVKVYGRVSNGV